MTVRAAIVIALLGVSACTQSGGPTQSSPGGQNTGGMASGRGDTEQSTRSVEFFKMHDGERQSVIRQCRDGRGDRAYEPRSECVVARIAQDARNRDADASAAPAMTGER